MDQIAEEEEYKEVPLIQAVVSGDIARVRALLREGANVNVTDYDGDTPLMCACERGRIGITRLLLTQRADINAISKSGDTALHKAAFYGKIGCVKLLLKYGAKVNEPTPTDGATPLMLAAREGWLHIVSLLIEGGADILIKDTSNIVTPQDAFTLAAFYGRTAVLERLLDEKPAVLSDTAIQGRLLTLAASTGKTACVQLLLDRGADVHARESNTQNTALMAAVMGGHFATTRLLLQRGADATLGDGFDTPIGIAEINHNMPLLRLLR